MYSGTPEVGAVGATGAHVGRDSHLRVEVEGCRRKRIEHRRVGIGRRRVLAPHGYLHLEALVIERRADSRSDRGDVLARNRSHVERRMHLRRNDVASDATVDAHRRDSVSHDGIENRNPGKDTLPFP